MSISRWLPVILLMTLIFALSSIPHLAFFHNNLPPDLLAFIRQHSIRFGDTGFFSYSLSLHPDNLIHKIGHFVLYGLLGISFYRATGRSVWWSITAVTIFALSDEFHQGLVPERSNRFGDVVLDMLSAVVFICIAKWKNSTAYRRAGN